MGALLESYERARDVAYSASPTPEPAPRSSGVSLFDLVSAFLAKAVEEGRAEIRRAEGESGRICVSVELEVEKGRPKFHRARAYFDRRFYHGEGV